MKRRRSEANADQAMQNFDDKRRGRKKIVKKTPVMAAVEGANVSEKMGSEKMFESFGKLNESFFSLDGAKKAAAWYIETTEKLATQALELQEKATEWAKETPLAPIFEAQTSIARKLIERSSSAARNLWRIEAA